MRFDILTIFPDLLKSSLEEGIIRKALQEGKIAVHIHNLRDFTTDKHAMTDDRPFGGGEGMVMKPEPIVMALEHVNRTAGAGHVVLLSPQGRIYRQKVAGELAEKRHIVLICGRYEGIDERVRQNFIQDEISVGDYILSGGELASLVLVDSITRIIPGVLGSPASASRETFSSGLLKYPQYTRPREFRDFSVPEVLLSGDHTAILEWRLIESLRQTARNRPDLLTNFEFSPEERKILKKSPRWLELIQDPRLGSLLKEKICEKREGKERTECESGST